MWFSGFSRKRIFGNFYEGRFFSGGCIFWYGGRWWICGRVGFRRGFGFGGLFIWNVFKIVIVYGIKIFKLYFDIVIIKINIVIDIYVYKDVYFGYWDLW